MKSALIAAAAVAASASGALAQTASEPTADMLSEMAQARGDALRAKVARMHQQIRSVSRDETIPEEARSERIEDLASEVQRDSDELAELVDRMMAARKAEIQRHNEAHAARSS